MGKFGPQPRYRLKRKPIVQPLGTSYRFIALTQNQNAIVDATDYDWLNQWNWYADWNKIVNGFVAIRRGGILMSRVILGCSTGEQADHWNHDTLDNRRENLRKCPPSNNCWNRRKRADSTSGFKGVSLNCGRWRSKITVRGKKIHLGYFSTPEEAAHAYDAAAKNYCGEFAFLNFPVHAPKDSPSTL